MAVGSETLGLGEGVELVGDGAFEGGRGGDVDDLPASGAEEVMVVFGQVLDQLEAGELIIGGYPPDDRCSLQVNQVTVSGAAGEVGKALGDITDTDGVALVYEEVDDGPATGGVALVDGAKPPRHDGM
jgi:hypothetical protein